jgi:hypothetical protein
MLLVLGFSWKKGATQNMLNLIVESGENAADLNKE